MRLSLRDVEELMSARGVDVSYETIRCWTIKFGPQIARRLRSFAPPLLPRWHLDEVVCSIGGKRMFLWRAVDDEGEVLDVVVQQRRGGDAALKLLRRLLRKQPVEPEQIVTDGLASYQRPRASLACGTCIPQADREKTIGRKTPTS